MHPSPANHPRCQPAWYRAAEHPTADADAAHGVSSSNPRTTAPPRMVRRLVLLSTDRDTGSTSGDTAGGTSNTVILNGSALPFDRNIIIHGGQGGNGGEGGGTGGNGGAGEGNQLQIHLTGETTLNVYYGGQNGDLEFVGDMVTCLVWLGLSALALACLHRLGWLDIGEVYCA
ncbi:hypothetical protein C8R44DRAFT_896502 [Mycena epipterygia]|nr:hypothetical protein C8R44DRAFT_896502 [Mycena epipterygia]